MSTLPFLPPLVYGLSLAIHGDQLLLIISVITLAIWLLPRLFEEKIKLPAEYSSLELAKPEPGTLVTVDGNPFKFPAGFDQVIRVDVATSELSDFYSSLSICLDEEVWILSDQEIGSAESMRRLNYKDNPLGLNRFLEDFERRAAIDFPLNLFVIGQPMKDFEQTWFTSLSHSSNLRVFISGEVSIKQMQLRAGLRNGVFQVRGAIDDQPIEFLMANSALTEGRQNSTNMADRLANLGHL